MRTSPGFSAADARRQASRPSRIVIVGAGAAGLEAALALREFGGDRADVQIYSSQHEFKIRPLAVWKALGQGEILSFDLERLAHSAGAGFTARGVRAVEPDHRRVRLDDGTEVTYDYLLVATGTKSLWVVPGAKTFWGSGSDESVESLLVLRDSGQPGRIVLTMPDLTAWPLPVYELALYLAAMTDDEAESQFTVTVATPEPSPLEVFGESASARMASLLADKRVEFLPGVVPIAFEDGALKTSSGEAISADEVITLPSLTGRRLEGIPYNENGFIAVDPFGRVRGVDQVFAAGDVSDFPVKFGSLSTGQADVAAATIAAHAWGKPQPEPYEPRLSAVLLTPDGPVPLEGDGGSDEVAGDEMGGWDPSLKLRGKYLSPFLASMKDD